MNQQTDLLETTALVVDDEAISHFKVAAAWSRFLAVMLFLFGIIIAIVGIISAMNNRGILDFWQTLLYFAGAALVFLMAAALLGFSNKTQKAIKENNGQEIAAAFKSLKQYFRLAGVMSIMITVFILLGILFIATFSR